MKADFKTIAAYDKGQTKGDRAICAILRREIAKDITLAALRRWLAKSKKIQWDYKNIVKRKGKLVRL